MTTRMHFAHRIDMCDADGAVIEHLAGLEDFLLAMATYIELLVNAGQMLRSQVTVFMARSGC
jgi:hypothetical protein